MIKGNELFVIAKMVSGEQVMACLNNEDERYVEFEYPILIRLIPTSHPNKETIAAAPYCQFSSETKYLIDKRNIMFIKRLHPTFVPHYIRFASEYDMMAGQVEQHQEESASVADLFEEEEEFLTIEEVNRRIEMLEAIAGLEPEKHDEEIPAVVVAGNKTLH